MIKINDKWYHTKEEKEKMKKYMKESKVDVKKGKTYEEYYGYERAKEIKLKLSKQTSSRSQEVFDKISKSNKGRVFSKDWRNKLSESKKGIKMPPFSKEHKRKLRISGFEYTKKVCGIIYPRIGHNEKQILDNLELEMNKKIKRQYPVEGYFVDGYIPELNLCIEVDEDHHFDRNGKLKEKDIERQEIIENKLNCGFVRV